MDIRAARLSRADHAIAKQTGHEYAMALIRNSYEYSFNPSPLIVC